jgi:hypothetical protein
MSAPIIDEFNRLSTDAERGAWLMQLSDSAVSAFIASINAALDKSSSGAGFEAGRKYIAARFAAHLAVRSMWGELPQTVAFALHLATGDLVAVIKKGMGE